MLGWMWDFCVKDPIYFAKGIYDYVDMWNCDENQYVDIVPYFFRCHEKIIILTWFLGFLSCHISSTLILVW
jgi:hypothetical protein